MPGQWENLPGPEGAPTFRDQQKSGRPRPGPWTPSNPVNPWAGGMPERPASQENLDKVWPVLRGMGVGVFGGGKGRPPGPLGQAPVAKTPPPSTVPGTPPTQTVDIPNALITRFANPSAYNQQMAQQTFDRLNTRLSEGFDIERQKVNEEMFRRGLDSSSVYGGRMGDLGVQQARAQTDLAAQIQEKAAMQQNEDWYRALQALLGYDQQNIDNQFRERGYNDAIDQQTWERFLQMLGY